MTLSEGIARLRSRIDEALLPLIGSKCVLYDVPYYKNIGDVLIWEGELCFLEQHSILLLDMASYNTCAFPELDSDVTILFQGGGNIGDLYHEHVEFLLSLVEHYPDNRIVVLSQTVFYQNEKQFDWDFIRLARHSDFYFAARDRFVYDKIVKYFGEKTLLLPDMAFCIPYDRFLPYIKKERLGLLRIVRKDCERPIGKQNLLDGKTQDWPVFDQSIRYSTLKNTVYDRLYKIPFLRNFLRDRWNSYAYEYFRIAMVKEGVQFISPYRFVQSERLHGAILAILLGKEVTIVDNSYKKNSNFYNTWLLNWESVSLM